MIANLFRTLPRVALIALVAHAVPALAQQQPVVVQGLDCRGEEPFWRVEEIGRAHV